MEKINISKLAFLLRENGDKVLNGFSKLSLSAELLQELNNSFHLVAEQETSSSFQVLKTNNSNVELFYDLQFLHDFVQKVGSLKISNARITLEGGVDITKFKNLKFLEISKIPIRCVSGLQNVRCQLKAIICFRCLHWLSDLLVACGGDQTEPAVWDELKEAIFSYNSIVSLDQSLTCVPWLEVLDLSHNKINSAQGIQCLPNLKYLNLSYNRLESIPPLHRHAQKKIRVLFIKNNCLEQISGLAGLEFLEDLDVSFNCLMSHEVLAPVSQLPALLCLSLKGNPLSFHPRHRLKAAAYVHRGAASNKVSKFLLDGMCLSKKEKCHAGAAPAPVELTVASSSAEEERFISSASYDGSFISDSGNESSRMAPKRGKKISKVRKAVIAECNPDEDAEKIVEDPGTSNIESPAEHLETKKQMEALREAFGEEHWLHSKGGSCVQDLLGLDKVIPAGTPSLEEILRHYELQEAASKAQVETTVESKAEDQNEAENASASKSEELPKITDSACSEDSLFGSKTLSPQPSEEALEECEEDEGEEDLYVVQREVGNLNGVEVDGVEELMLAVTESHIKERDGLSGRVRVSWEMESLQSCVRMKNNPVTVQLTFDTVRMDRQERVYLMQDEDAQKLVKILGDVLESRPLCAMNQRVFRCMKCSAQFSHEIGPKTVVDLSDHEKAGCTSEMCCPMCGSTYVFETEDVPEPSQERKIVVTTESVEPSKLQLPAGALSHSPSQSSIGAPGTEAVQMLHVVADVHAAELACSLEQDHASETVCSATSLAKSMESSVVGLVKRSDSDIEVLSNPSQSSIEVLPVAIDDQQRQASNAAEDSEPVQVVALTPDPDESRDGKAHVGLADSSSSGSLAESICTAYENKTNSQNQNSHSTDPPVSNGSQAETVSPEKSSVNKVQWGNVFAHWDMIENLRKPEKIVSETDSVGKSPPKHGQVNFGSVLEGLLQSVSRLGSSPPRTHKLEEGKRDIGDKVVYSYTDFSVVDHRVKLFLYASLFSEEQEELVALLKALVLGQSSSGLFPGCLVISTRKVYVLHVVGKEGDDPETWLSKVEACALKHLSCVFALPWQLGVGIEWEKKGVPPFLFLLQDSERTTNFITFLADAKCCSVMLEYEDKETDLQQLILTSARGGDIDLSLQLCTFCSSWVQRDEGSEKVRCGLLVVSATDIIVTQDDLRWLFPQASLKPAPRYQQKISNLTGAELVSTSPFILVLHFFEEETRLVEDLAICVETEAELRRLVESVRSPWEELFSVKFHVTFSGVSEIVL